MPGVFRGLLEDVNSYEGKNGFGANITFSARVGNRIKRLTFNIRDKDLAYELEKLLMKEIELELTFDQSNFGISIREILRYKEIKAS